MEPCGRTAMVVCSPPTDRCITRAQANRVLGDGTNGTARQPIVCRPGDSFRPGGTGTLRKVKPFFIPYFKRTAGRVEQGFAQQQAVDSD